jgi:hypothetical protein
LRGCALMRAGTFIVFLLLESVPAESLFSMACEP